MPFAAASVVGFIMGAGLFGSTYLLPLFVQTIQGFTPTHAGLPQTPSGLVLVVVFLIAGRMSDRVPPGIGGASPGKFGRTAGVGQPALHPKLDEIRAAHAHGLTPQDNIEGIVRLGT